MSIVLKNKNLRLEFHNSEEGYQGSRFTQIGKLIAVTFKGETITANELQNGFSNLHGAGFYNEFDIDTALGYSETKKGDWFHKIGVGLLKKNDEAYDFFKKYEFKKISITTESNENSIAFEANQKEYNGYSYVLKQTYTLNENGFSINYSIKNSGLKTIKTYEYNHNFLLIQQEFIGYSYSLNFVPEVRMTSSSEFVNPNKAVDFNAKRLTFKGTPESDYFLSDLQAESSDILGWELVQERFKIKAKIDFAPTKMNIWGARHVISPELFVEIQVKPNEEKTWSRSYEFEAL